MTDAPRLHADQIVGGAFRIGSELSSGAFGFVFEGERVEDGLPVVVKALREGAPDSDPAAAHRFVQEAAVAARLDHPNIVRTLSFGQSRDGVLYIVLERLHGKTLAEAMFEQRLPPEVVQEVVCQMLKGLEHAHEKQIVHRDMKPSNLFVCDPDHISAYGQEEGDLVKLLDFGFLKVLDSSSPVANLTMAGMVVGTPGYIAPELLRDSTAVTPKVDLYGAGVLGFEMLTAQQAFPGTGMHRAMAQLNTVPQPPAELASLPVTGAIMQLMARDPDDRFQTATEALATFEAL